MISDNPIAGRVRPPYRLFGHYTELMRSAHRNVPPKCTSTESGKSSAYILNPITGRVRILTNVGGSAPGSEVILCVT
jgi:hypothetical protein